MPLDQLICNGALSEGQLLSCNRFLGFKGKGGQSNTEGTCQVPLAPPGHELLSLLAPSQLSLDLFAPFRSPHALADRATYNIDDWVSFCNLFGGGRVGIFDQVRAEDL